MGNASGIEIRLQDKHGTDAINRAFVLSGFFTNACIYHGLECHA